MSSLFAGLKEKFADKLAEFKGSAAPIDPADKQAADLVEAATSDELIAPDWGLNFSVIDYANSDVRHNSGRVLKAIKRSFAKPNTKVQLLSLALLDACVKNSAVEFHEQLATSELWADVVKVAEDTSITRVEADVRDQVLGMVEDFARLQPVQFQAVYGNLLDRGVDFPVRNPNQSLPIVTPPASEAAAAEAPAAGGAAAVIAIAPPGGEVPAAAVAAGAAGANVAAAEADPLAGVDEQDRAAIQAALADLEQQAEAAQEAARIAAEADAEERRQHRLQQQEAQQQQQAQFLVTQQQQQAAMEAEAALGLLAAAQTAEAAAAAQAATVTATGAAATATAGDFDLGVAIPATQQQQQPYQADPRVPGAQQPQPQAEEVPEAPVGERVAILLETSNNTTLLLSEMLASVPDSEPLAVREPFVAEVADTCVRLRSRLERDLVTLADEALLASALSQHEELSRVLMRYDELLAAAESVAPTVPRNAAAVAMSHAAVSRGVAAAGGVPPPSHGQRFPVQQQPADPHHQQQHGQTVGTETAGQKVAAVAAALKERFTGAFDKLMAAARAPGALPPSSTAVPASTGYNALGSGGSGGATPTGAGTAGGAFTLLDDEDEEANEGTALITKRTSQPGASTAQAAALQPQLQQLMHDATGAVEPPPPPPPQPAAAEPDLISFSEDASPQAPPPPPPSQRPQPAAGVPFIGIEVTQSSTEGLQDLLSGLNVHAPTASPPPPPAAVELPFTPPLPPLAPMQAPPSRVSGGGSGGDQLMEALDRLVSQSSLNASPMAGAEAPALPHAPVAPQQLEPQPQQQQVEQ